MGTARSTYPLVEVVAAELNGRVGDDANAIGAIASHESPPALLSPHLAKRLPDRQLILVTAGALDLKQYLQALQRGDDSAGDCAGHPTGAKGRNYRLRNELLELDRPLARRIFGSDDIFGAL